VVGGAGGSAGERGRGRRREVGGARLSPSDTPHRVITRRRRGMHAGRGASARGEGGRWLGTDRALVGRTAGLA
jgi:hypothetical protein